MQFCLCLFYKKKTSQYYLEIQNYIGSRYIQNPMFSLNCTYIINYNYNQTVRLQIPTS